MTWALRGGHNDIDASRRNDAIETNVETVSEEQRVAFGKIRSDLCVVHRLLLGVGKQDHDRVGPLGGVGNRHDRQAFRFGLGLRGRTLAQTNNDVDARLFEVERMGMALRAVTNDGDLAVGDE